MQSINKIILKNADFVLNKKLPVGHNGPYKDKETKVRSNAHWAIVLLKAFV